MDKIQKNLFSTPVNIYNILDCEQLNARLLSRAGEYKTGQDYLTQYGDEFATLKTELRKCIRDYTENTGVDFDWLTITGRQNPIFPGGNDSPHHHPDSIIVGVYYITVPDQSGAILLHDPRGSINWPDSDTQTNLMLKTFRPYHRIEPKAGQFIIFPGYLIHSVETNLSQDIRISVAVNMSIEIKK